MGVGLASGCGMSLTRDPVPERVLADTWRLTQQVEEVLGHRAPSTCKASPRCHREPSTREAGMVSTLPLGISVHATSRCDSPVSTDLAIRKVSP